MIFNNKDRVAIEDISEVHIIEEKLKGCPFCGRQPMTWWDISEENCRDIH